MTLTKAEAEELIAKYPDNIPIRVVAELISRGSGKRKKLCPQSLRVAIQRGACPFAWGIPPKKDEGAMWRYRVETHQFVMCYCPGYFPHLQANHANWSRYVS